MLRELIARDLGSEAETAYNRWPNAARLAGVGDARTNVACPNYTANRAASPEFRGRFVGAFALSRIASTPWNHSMVKENPVYLRLLVIIPACPPRSSSCSSRSSFLLAL